MNSGMILIASSAALALTACGSQETDDSKPRKGMYKTEVELTELEIPGLTEDVKEAAKGQMKSMFAAQSGNERCLGGGEADWTDVAKEISSGLGNECETVRDNGTASSADLEMKCAGTQLGDVTLTVKGGAESESFNMNLKLKLVNMPVGGDGTMDMSIAGERVGDC